MLGKVYKLVFDDGSVYIGSTVKTTGRRLTEHFRDKKEYESGKRPRKCCCFDKLTPTTKIELLEEIPVMKAKDPDLLSLEQKWIDTIECINVNKSSGRKDRTEYINNWRNSNQDKCLAYYLKAKESMIYKKKVKRLLIRELQNYNL